MDKGEHKWCIDAKLLETMIAAKNMEKFISPTFKISHLIWQIESYPNGNTPSNIGSFNLYLRLVSIPFAWKNITIRRTFKCNETQSGYTAISKYDEKTSLGWPDFTLSLQDIKTRIHWIDPLQFIINIKILQISLHKNNGEIFYEYKLDPNKLLKHQSMKWKIQRNLLHEMKQSYFKKGFVSPIFNNLWCLRVYPSGKTVKGDFLIQLQLCALPIQCNTLKAKWKIYFDDIDVSVEWNTGFNYNQSCWGWGNNHLSFDKFKKCDTFTIHLEVTVDTIDNIVAMAEWHKFVYTNRDLEYKYDADDAMDVKEEEKRNPPQISISKAKSTQQKSTWTQWIVNRLKIQDEMLDVLTNDVEQSKQDIDTLKAFEYKQNDDGLMNNDLKNKVLKIEKELGMLSKMRGNIGVVEDKILSEKEKVEIWLRDKVKLGEYYELFIDQGFDELECIVHITKDDLSAMHIDKIGHQRKILNHAQNIIL